MNLLFIQDIVIEGSLGLGDQLNAHHRGICFGKLWQGQFSQSEEWAQGGGLEMSLAPVLDSSGGAWIGHSTMLRGFTVNLPDYIRRKPLFGAKRSLMPFHTH